MLLVRVFVDSGLVAPFDPRPYPSDWHLHRSEERYLGLVFDRAREIDASDTVPARQDSAVVEPGDVMVLRFGRCYSHGGIVASARPLRIVHAYYQARCVLEEEVGRSAVLSDPRRKPRFFSFWAKRS